MEVFIASSASAISKPCHNNGLFVARLLLAKADISLVRLVINFFGQQVGQPAVQHFDMLKCCKFVARFRTFVDRLSAY